MFTWQLPRMGKKRPIFGKHGRILPCALALGRGPSKYKAVANIWDLLQSVYCTYQGPNMLNIAAVAEDFSRHGTLGTASWYLLRLQHYVAAMLQNIWPFGLPTFCGDISASINHFLEYGHNVHTNWWGGGGGASLGWVG